MKEMKRYQRVIEKIANILRGKGDRKDRYVVLTPSKIVIETREMLPAPVPVRVVRRK